jgi:hypothetical protein
MNDTCVLDLVHGYTPTGRRNMGPQEKMARRSKPGWLMLFTDYYYYYYYS